MLSDNTPVFDDKGDSARIPPRTVSGFEARKALSRRRHQNGQLLKLEHGAGGTSDTSAPSWSTTVGNTTVDNSVTWYCLGHGSNTAYAGYNWVACFRSIYGHLSTASPILSSNGPILGPQPAPITAWSVTSNVITFTAANNFNAGDIFIVSGLVTGSTINGLALRVQASGLSATQFEAPLAHANASATETGIANPAIMTLYGQGSTDPSTTSTTFSITEVAVSNDIATCTAANTLVPGLWVQLSGLSGASFLNGQTVQVASANSTSFTFFFTHADYGPTSDSGHAQFQSIEIYRTKDGGGLFYFAGAQTNGGGVGWSFADTAVDGNLITSLTAPLAHINDPPPSGGTLLAYWNGRMWMAVGNRVYFSAGPDCLNGIPEEAWPGYLFTFPGQVIALRVTQGGVIVQTPDEVWSIQGGPQTTAFFPDQLQGHIGILNDNCVSIDGIGGSVYVYTTGNQLFDAAQSPPNEVGFRVANVLRSGISGIAAVSAFSPLTSSITVHRDGQDQGLWISNGVDTLLRYGLGQNNCWSTPYQPLLNGSTGIGVVKSIETSAGVWSLLLSSNRAQDYIYYRNFAATSFEDNGNAYDAAPVVGNVVITEPGQPLLPVYFVSLYGANVGSVPTMSILINEISATNGASFTTLPVAQNEPALLPGSKSIMAKRWPTLANSVAQCVKVRHLQAKIDYGTDTVANELYSLGFSNDMEQLS